MILDFSLIPAYNLAGLDTRSDNYEFQNLTDTCYIELARY
jgi:hypothetical protein